MNSYRQARMRSFLLELEPTMFGSTVTFKGRVFNVVASSKAAEKQGQQANYLALKGATFDFPADTSILPRSGVTVPGFDANQITLRQALTAEGVDYEIFQIMDDPQEPFVRCVCNRKQNQSTAI